MPDTTAIRPDEVLAAYAEIVVRELFPHFTGRSAGWDGSIRHALAAVLTLAREDIASRVEDPETMLTACDALREAIVAAQAEVAKLAGKDGGDG